MTEVIVTRNESQILGLRLSGKDYYAFNETNFNGCALDERVCDFPVVG